MRPLSSMNKGRPETSMGIPREGLGFVEKLETTGDNKDSSPNPSMSFNRLSKMSTKASVTMVKYCLTLAYSLRQKRG